MGGCREWAGDSSAGARNKFIIGKDRHSAGGRSRPSMASTTLGLPVQRARGLEGDGQDGLASEPSQDVTSGSDGVFGSVFSLILSQSRFS